MFKSSQKITSRVLRQWLERMSQLFIPQILKDLWNRQMSFPSDVRLFYFEWKETIHNLLLYFISTCLGFKDVKWNGNNGMGKAWPILSVNISSKKVKGSISTLLYACHLLSAWCTVGIEWKTPSPTLCIPRKGTALSCASLITMRVSCVDLIHHSIIPST